MIELVLTVCSILHGAKCKEVVLTFEDHGQLIMPTACALGAMMEIVKWNESNPNWQVVRFKCASAGKRI